MQRVLSIVAVAVLLGFCGALSPATSVTAKSSSDLAGMAIYPADTGEDGYILLDGRFCLTTKSCADPTFFGGVTEDTLKGDGLVRAYAIALAKFDPADPTSPQRSIATTIAEYGTSKGATAGLSHFISWLADPDGEVSVSSGIGDDAQMFEVKGEVAGDANAKGAVGLRFRSGTLVVGIEIRDYTGTLPDRDAAETLGRLVAGRIDSGDAPGLSALTVNLRSGGSSYYVHRDGTTVPLLRENATQYESRSQEFADSGVQDVFLTSQNLVTGSDPQSPEAQMSIVLYQLPTGNDASNYMARASTALSSSWDAANVPYTEPDDTPLLGDESVWFINVYDTVYEATVYVRSGHYVARIIWQQNLPKAVKSAEKEIPTAQERLLPGIEFTAQAQVQCIENLGCTGITKLGKDLLPSLS